MQLQSYNIDTKIPIFLGKKLLDAVIIIIIVEKWITTAVYLHNPFHEKKFKMPEIKTNGYLR